MINSERRAATRSKHYISEETLMTREEIRQENRKPIESEETAKKSLNAQKGKFITQAITAYMEGNETFFNSLSDNLKSYVLSMISNAKSGNAGIISEVNNRYEGKVKDELSVDFGIRSHIPEQEQLPDDTDKYKLPEPIEPEYKLDD